LMMAMMMVSINFDFIKTAPVLSQPTLARLSIR